MVSIWPTRRVACSPVLTPISRINHYYFGIASLLDLLKGRNEIGVHVDVNCWAGGNTFLHKNVCINIYRKHGAF